MASKHIYPVPIKPASGISTWSGWPDDVRALLRRWNGGRMDGNEFKRQNRLTFRRSAKGSLYQAHVSVFKCADCEEFCEPHAHGAAVHNGDWLCDDCLIARARAALAALTDDPSREQPS